MIACAVAKGKFPLANSIYIASNAVNMGYLATSKTKIKNSILLLDEKPNYNSGKILNIYSLTFPNSPYTFTLPNFIKNVDILSFTFNLIDTYVDDWLYVHINNHRYLLGGAWSVCNNFDNIYCSPVKTTSLNISESDLNFETSNTLSFLFQNGSISAYMQIWLILKEFKFSFTYRTK